MADVWKKLLLHKAGKALALNVPEESHYEGMIGGLPEGLEVVDTVPSGEEGVYDFVHLFVKSAEELESHAPSALHALKGEGLFWISYPKKSSKIKTDISRDYGWRPITAAGYVGVTQIAIDDTWSALRFRPEASVPVLTRKSKITND